MGVAQTTTARAVTGTQERPRSHLPRIRIADGSIEALKVLALLLMTIDHANKYLTHGAVSAAFAAGRLAFPLFGFVLAYNLARPGTWNNGTYRRVMTRLAAYGLAASVPFIGLGGVVAGWWPLNILFTLMVAVGCMALLERGGWCGRLGAPVLFAFGGAFVEFWWFALVYCLGAWAYCRRPSWGALAAWIGGTASLYVINQNAWALAALPVIALATRIDMHMPRLRHASYLYYPAHLAVLWAIVTYLH